MQKKWAIMVAVALGLFAVFLTNLYFQQKEETFRLKKGKEGQVLVAAKDISKGATIDYEMLGFKVVPVKFIEPKALKAKESAVGKTALVTIVAGEQILPSKLVAPGRGLTLAAKTPPGKRAFTISLDTAALVGGMVKPGDHVDVLAIFTAPAITLTLFQDILILAVGREMVPKQEERDKKKVSSTARSTVTMAVTPQEVQILTVAMQHGKIRLTLRPQMETGKVLLPVDLSHLPPAIDLNTLLQLYIRRPEAQLGPQVEVIRGLEKEITPLPPRKRK